MNTFNEKFIAVGVTGESEGVDSGVVVVVAGLGKFTMLEGDARKLADDILRNANYLWPDKTQEMIAEMHREMFEKQHQMREMVKP
jgi:hypothetical protein